MSGQKLSDKTQRKNTTKPITQTIRLADNDLLKFRLWLRCRGVNISKWTRLLWKNTPEFEEYLKLEDTSWLEEEVEKMKTRRRS